MMPSNLEQLNAQFEIFANEGCPSLNDLAIRHLNANDNCKIVDLTEDNDEVICHDITGIQ